MDFEQTPPLLLLLLRWPFATGMVFIRTACPGRRTTMPATKNNKRPARLRSAPSNAVDEVFLSLSDIEAGVAAGPSGARRVELLARLAIEKFRRLEHAAGLEALRRAEEAAAAPGMDVASFGLPVARSWMAEARAVHLLHRRDGIPAAALMQEQLEDDRLPEGRRYHLMARQALCLSNHGEEQERCTELAAAVLCAPAAAPHAQHLAALAAAVAAAHGQLQPEALQHFERARRAARQAGDEYGVGSVVVNMAVLHGLQVWERCMEGRADDEALKQAVVGVQGSISVGPIFGRRRASVEQGLMLASLHALRGQHDEALALWREYVPRDREGNRHGLWPVCQAHWALVLQRQEQLPRALALAREAESALDDLDATGISAVTARRYLGLVFQAGGEIGRAERHLSEAYSRERLMQRRRNALRAALAPLSPASGP